MLKFIKISILAIILAAAAALSVHRGSVAQASTNTAPYIATPYLTNSTVGEFHYQPIIAYDDNKLDALTITSTGLPEGFTLENCTRSTSNDRSRHLCYIWGTPVQAGTYTVTFTVTDDRGLSSNRVYTMKVKPSALVQPTITSVTVKPCGSTSCYGITTIQVDGTGYDANARVEVIGQNDSATRSGILVGGNMTTTILTDFSSLPCQVYDVRVYFTTDSRQVIKTSAFSPSTCG